MDPHPIKQDGVHLRTKKQDSSLYFLEENWSVTFQWTISIPVATAVKEKLLKPNKWYVEAAKSEISMN